MDVAALLSPRDDEEPSGEDLEYDQDFTEMELAALPGEEKQVGDEFIPGDDPDYREVTAKAMSVLERSHDLRAGVFLANSELALRGLEGFADATRYIRGCLETHWDTCHPQLDEDDDNDPTMRINSILTLADGASVLRNLREAPMTDSRTFGRFSWRDCLIANGEITAPEGMENVPDEGSINAAFQDSDEELMKARGEAAKAAYENVVAINAVFDEQTPGQGPELDPLVKILRQISGRFAAATGGEDVEVEEESEDGEDAGAPVAAAGGAGKSVPGAINSSTDVQNALDRIIAYYARSEPSSPVPILLVRAKRLVSADFLTIMKDMAPAGVDSVHTIGGIRDE